MLTYESPNYKLIIEHDEFSFNPRVDFDNLGKMVTFHRRYELGDSHSLNFEDYGSFEDMIKEVVGIDGVYLNLYLYDHSGLDISYRPFGDRWDSGQVGFIYASKEDIMGEYGDYTPESKGKAVEVLKGEVEDYARYLRGEVYSYSLIKKIHCAHCGETKEDVIESLCGIMSDNLTKELSEFLEDDKALIELQEFNQELRG